MLSLESHCFSWFHLENIEILGKNSLFPSGQVIKCYLLYSWSFPPTGHPFIGLVHGHMTSNNKTAHHKCQERATLRKLWRQTGNSSLLPAKGWPLLYMYFSNSLIIHTFDRQYKMAKFVTCMSFDTQWKPRWKPHVFWISYPNHTLFSSDSSLDIKIHASKQKKLNIRTEFLTNSILGYLHL